MLASLCNARPFDPLTPASTAVFIADADPVMATPLAVAAASAVFAAAGAGAIIGAVAG